MRTLSPSGGLLALFTLGARRPIATVLFVLVVTAIALTGLGKLRMDVSYASLTDPADPQRPIYQEVVNTFGSDSVTLIHIKDETLFTPEKLALVEKLTHELQAASFVERVDSLFTVANVREMDGALDTSPIFGAAPSSRMEAERGRDAALENPLIGGTLLGLDARSTVIIIYARPNSPDETVYGYIEQRVSPLRASFDLITQIGNPRAQVESRKAISDDLAVLTPLAFVFIIVFNWLMLRTWISCALPALCGALAILWCLGFCGILGIPLNTLSAAIPALLVIMGAESTYMLSAYLRSLDEAQGSREKAVRLMAQKVAVPTLLTAGTTALGFSSGLLAKLALLQQFGLAGALGICLSFVVTVLSGPLLLRFFGPRHQTFKSIDLSGRGIFDRIAQFVERRTLPRPRAVLCTALLATAGCIGLMFTLSPNNDPLSYLHEHHPIIIDADRLHRDVSGSGLLFVTIDGGKAGAFVQPDNLTRLARAAEIVAASGRFDKVISFVDHIRLVHREFAGAAATDLPDRPDLIEQYLLFFQSRDLQQFVTPDHSRANIHVRHFIHDSREMLAAVEKIEAGLSSLFPTGSVSINSENLLIDRSSRELVDNQFATFLLVLAVIVVAISAVYRAPSYGLVMLVANVLPCVSVFAAMSLFGFPLNPGTAIVAVLGLGVAVNDTIHILATYTDMVHRGCERRAAVLRTMRAQIPAVTTTSLGLVAGLLVLTVSEFTIVAQLGILCASALAVAALADLAVTPVLLDMIARPVSKAQVLGRAAPFFSSPPSNAKPSAGNRPESSATGSSRPLGEPPHDGGA